MTQKDEGQDDEINSESIASVPETPAAKETPDARRIQLEKDVCKKYADGDISEAIEALKRAIEVDRKWYHYFCKAQWLYEKGDIVKASKSIEKGKQLDPKSTFWFYFLEATLVYRFTQVNMFVDLDKSNRDLTSALSLMEQARYIHDTEEGFANIWTTFCVVPDIVKSVIRFIDPENLSIQVLSFRGDIERLRHSLVLYKEIQRVNANMQAAQSKIDSERIKTIELLGIFTAIISFVIIAGTSALKMKTFEIAMPILGSLALVLLLLVSALTLFTTKYTHYKDMFHDLRLYVFVFLVIIICGLICYSVNKTAEQNNPIIPRTSTKISAPLSIKADDLSVAPGANNKAITDKDKGSQTQ